MRMLAAAALIAALLPVGAAQAAMSSQQRDHYLNICQNQMYESAATCACMADYADKTLDDTSIDYITTEANDIARAAALAKQMTDAERAAVDRFTSTVLKQCRK